MASWIRVQLGAEFLQISIQLTRESHSASNVAHYGRDHTVEITVVWILVLLDALKYIFNGLILDTDDVIGEFQLTVQ